MAKNVVVPPFDTAPQTVVGSTPQSVFDFDFPFWDESDVLVLIDGDPLDQALYTVEGFFLQNGTPVEGGYGSGRVTLNAPVSQCVVTIDRLVRTARESQFGRSAPLPMPSLNSDLNKLTARHQDLARQFADFTAIAIPDAADIDFTAAGLDAVQQSMQAKLRRIVDVEDFGVVSGVGADRAANDAALANAINKVRSSKAVLRFGPNRYEFSASTPTIVEDGVFIQADYSTIDFESAGQVTGFRWAGPGDTGSALTLASDLTDTGNDPVMVLTNASTISAGDYVRVEKTVNVTDVPGQIFRVRGKSTNTLTLDKPPAFNVATSDTYVIKKWVPLVGGGILGRPNIVGTNVSGAQSAGVLAYDVMDWTGDIRVQGWNWPGFGSYRGLGNAVSVYCFDSGDATGTLHDIDIRLQTGLKVGRLDSIASRSKGAMLFGCVDVQAGTIYSTDANSRGVKLNSVCRGQVDQIISLNPGLSEGAVTCVAFSGSCDNIQVGRIIADGGSTATPATGNGIWGAGEGSTNIQIGEAIVRNCSYGDVFIGATDTGWTIGNLRCDRAKIYDNSGQIKVGTLNGVTMTGEYDSLTGNTLFKRAGVLKGTINSGDATWVDKQRAPRFVATQSGSAADTLFQPSGNAATGVYFPDANSMAMVANGGVPVGLIAAGMSVGRLNTGHRFETYGDVNSRIRSAIINANSGGSAEVSYLMETGATNVRLERILSNGSGGPYIQDSTGASVTGGAYLDYGTARFRTAAGAAVIAEIATSAWTPGTDGLANLGATSLRFNVVYAATGAINTSDATEKTELAPFDDAVIRAAKRIAIGSYQWLSAIALKGEDGARIHFGTTAQSVAAAFEAEGLDPHRYALFCADPIFDLVAREEEVVVERDGELVIERRTFHDHVPIIDPGTGEQKVRLGVRYDQLLVLLIAAQAA